MQEHLWTFQEACDRWAAQKALADGCVKPVLIDFLPGRTGEEPRGFRGAHGKPAARRGDSGLPEGEERRRVHKIAQYAAAGTVHPEGGKDESSQPRTSASPCNLCLGPFEPASSTPTNDSLPATRLLRSEKHRQNA
jgi:hypothetical protein